MRILQLRGQGTQGDQVETSHRIAAVSVAGDDVRPIDPLSSLTGSTWRSAAKPLQLWCSLEALSDPPELAPEWIALGASSHSGQDGQVAGVRAILARFGLDEGQLQCGAEPPAHRPTAEALLREGKPFLAVHNDCSGKHAFMLAACHAQGWSTADYLDPVHPLQQRILALARGWCQEQPGVAVDGCGLPTLHLSLTGMARVWERLGQSLVEPQRDPRLHRIARAMADHPWFTSGDQRIDLALHRRATEPWIGKIGARGVFCFALPARGIGGALKVLDGDEDALAVAVPALVERLAPGALRPDPQWPYAQIRNVVGRIVGTRVVRDEDGV